MRGEDDRSEGMFSYVRPEQRVPADHPLRVICAVVDRALVELSAQFEVLYSHTGRPSIPPEKLLRALLLQAGIATTLSQLVRLALASRDLGVHGAVLRNWVKAFGDDPEHAFPGHGQTKPEQAEIARLKREVTKLKAQRAIQKSRSLLREGIDVRFGFIVKHRGI